MRFPNLLRRVVAAEPPLGQDLVLDQAESEAFAGRALFSADRTRRLTVVRLWDDSKPLLFSMGLNPSDAGAEKNDRTLSKIVGFAQRAGYGGVFQTNISDHIETDAAVWDELGRPTSEANIRLIASILKPGDGRPRDAWPCWGGDGATLRNPSGWFPDAEIGPEVTIMMTGLTKDGCPRHPSRGAYEPGLRPARPDELGIA